MAIQILLKANNSNPDIKKGMVVDMQEEPCSWGNKECLPEFIIIRIVDGTIDDVNKYREEWVGTFEYVVNNHTVTMTINPKIFSDLGKTINPNIKSFISGKGLTVVSDNETSITFNIPVGYDTDSLFSELNDVFVETVAARAYRIPEENVDLVIAAGGFVERSKAYAESIAIDRRI